MPAVFYFLQILPQYFPGSFNFCLSRPDILVKAALDSLNPGRGTHTCYSLQRFRDRVRCFPVFVTVTVLRCFPDADTRFHESPVKPFSVKALFRHEDIRSSRNHITEMVRCMKNAGDKKAVFCKRIYLHDSAAVRFNKLANSEAKIVCQIFLNSALTNPFGQASFTQHRQRDGLGQAYDRDSCVSSADMQSGFNLPDALGLADGVNRLDCLQIFLRHQQRRCDFKIPKILRVEKVQGIRFQRCC